MKISVIFPIAGLGSRFGYQFKPFILATDYTFIELAKQPFELLKNYNYEPEYYFIYRKSQEDSYNVARKLHELFPNDIIHCLIIKDTDGPLQTIQEAIKNYKISGIAFVCDCDHAINIEPMIKNIDLLQHYNILIPTWNITEKDFKLFGKVKLNHKNEIIDFCEKEVMNISDENDIVKGLLGCYLFKDISLVSKYPNYENISNMLKQMHNEKQPLITIQINKADFFGTPKTLEEFRFKRAQKYTLFIDIDGTLIHQTTQQVLPGTIDKLNYWRSLGYSIILTTAKESNKRNELDKLLKECGIEYDDIIMNLSPGPRYIINDRKPYIPYYAMASGIIIDRNDGIMNIELPHSPPVIIKTFDGASFAQVYLIENVATNKKFVRKYISYTNENAIHIDILKRQCDDLKRLHYYKPSMFPKILNEYCSTSEYYYDMEYFEEYEPLSKFTDKIIYESVSRILNDLITNVYCYKKYITINQQNKWIKEFLDEKIHPKFKIIGELHPGLHSLINKEYITINNKKYKSIQEYLEVLSLDKFTPEFLCPIHGDLTLENILYNKETNDYKLIDPAGSRYMDAVEMDIGKLFQSLVTNYVSWKDCYDLVEIVNDDVFKINSMYVQNKYENLKNLFDKREYDKGIFYMCTYFIRMIPFMFNKSYQHAVFTILLCIHYLDTLV
jgi:hydroxymethylpyrimidine pyrophosphatase-like HAD family hydrolase